MRLTQLLWVTVLAACDPAPDASAKSAVPTDQEVCRVAMAPQPLPREIAETSGLAESRNSDGVFWTHNDSGNPSVLFALRSDGSIAGRVQLSGAKLRDWEDIDAGSCASGSCLYLADIGDNGGKRTTITIYEVDEPAVDAQQTTPARALHARYPDGQHDAEALFRMPNGDLYIVSKGRRGPIMLYRYPQPYRPNDTIVLQPVKQLAPRPDDPRDWITGAAARVDGEWIAIRSYRRLEFYRAPELLGAGVAQPITFDLSVLGERQGESVAFARDGSVWLTSESESRRHPPTWSRLMCTLE